MLSHGKQIKAALNRSSIYFWNIFEVTEFLKKNILNAAKECL